MSMVPPSGNPPLPDGRAIRSTDFYGQRRSTTYTIRARSCAGTAPGALGAGMACSVARRCLVADGLGLGRRRGGSRDHPGLGPAHALATGMVPTALRDGAGHSKRKIATGTMRPQQGPRRNQGHFRSGHQAAGAVAGRTAQHHRRTHQDGNLDRKDPALWKEFQPRRPWKNGASPVQAPGGTCRISGVPQGPGRQGKSRPTRSGASPRPSPPWSSTACWPSHGKAQGLTTRRRSRSTRPTIRRSGGKSRSAK